MNMPRLIIATSILVLAPDSARLWASEPKQADLLADLWMEVAEGRNLLKGHVYGKARSTLSRALKGFEDRYGEDSPEIAPIVVLLSSAEAGLGSLTWRQTLVLQSVPGHDLLQAERKSYLLRQKSLENHALRLIEKHYGKSSVEYADLNLLLAQSRLDHGSDRGGALKFARDAHAIYSELTTPDHAGMAAVSLILGRISLLKDHVDKAIEHLSHADDRFSKLPDLADSRLGLPAVSLGDVFLNAGRLELAEYYFQIALKSLSTDEPQNIGGYIEARSGMVSAYVLAGKEDLANEHCAEVRLWANRVDSGIKQDKDAGHVRVAPRYPWAARVLGVEGFVDFSFTVDEEGFVQSPTVIHVKGHAEFVPAAIRALCRFHYPPRVENGKPVSVEDVKTRISFKIR